MSVERIRLISDGAMRDEEGKDIPSYPLVGPWAEKNETRDGVECAVFLHENQLPLCVLKHVKHIKREDGSDVPMLDYEITRTHTKIYVRVR